MINLIPKPQSFKTENGTYKLRPDCKVFTEIELPLLTAPLSEDGEIRILKDSALAKEEYYLKVNADGVLIKASCENGAYYALQSLRMLGRFDEGKNEIPFVEISDKPEYSWRGVHLDESRHFFGKEYVKKLIDELFRLKMNIFHWHLTDDNGWRIEIKKYPLLTEIGSIRAYTHIKGWHSGEKDETPYGGFYTQEDIKEIVEYAEKRCVSIVPEIDAPAHFAAALAAYPHLACRDLKREVQGHFGGAFPRIHGMTDWNRPICPGKEENIQFILDVYDEVCELFPFDYFHIGGDECDVTEWKTCPECQRVMKEKGFTNERELQLMLTNRLCAYLKSKGRHMIGWNEVLRVDGIDESAVAQYWEPGRDKNVEKFASAGGKIIMSKHQSFYIDHPYAIYPVKNTYNFAPENYGVSKDKVLGVEGELWTEWVATPEKADFMYHPRMEAISEVGWTDIKNRSYGEFVKRYKGYKSIYPHLGITYAVDKIAMPKNPLRRAKLASLFRGGDPDYEFKLNKKFYDEGER